jgi:excinuclease ABC subunit A
MDKIVVKNAKHHNLKNVSLEIPKYKMVVFTGVSGSGKSSMAMDTIFAEGQRRYVESLSAYARQFLGVMEKPDVESIDGLSPSIAIDQKTTSRNPRSTVGTITEIYDYLRLLYARVGHPHCPECGSEISRLSIDQIFNNVILNLNKDKNFKSPRGVRFMIISPIIKEKKGEYQSLFENLRKQGVVRARVDGKVRDLNDEISLLKNNKHTIEGVIFRGSYSERSQNLEDSKKEFESNLIQNLESALKMANGNAILSIINDDTYEFPEEPKEMVDHLYSENFACPNCLISLPDIEPRTFSFNSPFGACKKCDGLGIEQIVDEETVLNKNLSIAEGGIMPWGRFFEYDSWILKVLEAVCKENSISMVKPISELSKNDLNIILNGFPEDKKFRIKYRNQEGKTSEYDANYEGVLNYLLRKYRETKSDNQKEEIEKYLINVPCSLCHGSRLNSEALSVVIQDKNISEVCALSIDEFQKWSLNLETNFNEREKKISDPILKEITFRIKFLVDVGLTYLSLDRSSAQLSGGEAQRIRLASQIGSGLSGVLYVLDEPSIGLHPRDQAKLIKTLHHLRDLGNTLIVVEHDNETMLESDYIVDFGPGAGEFGGKVISQGTPEEIMKDSNSITGKYLSGKLKVGHKGFKVPEEEKQGRKKWEGEYLLLKNAKGRNLKGVDLTIPLGKLISVTGVSGSGKSTLIMDTFLKELRQYFGLKNEEKPEPNDGLFGCEHLDKVISIDQNPIGRTPKSNPATYTKVFDEIRDLFAQTEDSKIRGYQPGRFSFNVKGGRCEACFGEGQVKIEMQFMPDVYVNCEVCNGKRYNREALEIVYKGKNIADVLDMNVDEASTFFRNIPGIYKKLSTLSEVGLGYIKLGQSAPTLSGGEAQRVKLATELAKRSTGRTLYILDEPTTGLHFADLENLISVLKRLVATGNTVLVIEHNLDIVLNSDFIVDLGPEGGKNGGQKVFEGSLPELLKHKSSHTAEALRRIYKL